MSSWRVRDRSSTWLEPAFASRLDRYAPRIERPKLSSEARGSGFLSTAASGTAVGSTMCDLLRTPTTGRTRSPWTQIGIAGRTPCAVGPAGECSASGSVSRRLS